MASHHLAGKKTSVPAMTRSKTISQTKTRRRTAIGGTAIWGLGNQKRTQPKDGTPNEGSAEDESDKKKRRRRRGNMSREREWAKAP